MRLLTRSSASLYPIDSLTVVVARMSLVAMGMKFSSQVD